MFFKMMKIMELAQEFFGVITDHQWHRMGYQKVPTSSRCLEKHKVSEQTARFHLSEGKAQRNLERASASSQENWVKIKLFRHSTW